MPSAEFFRLIETMLRFGTVAEVRHAKPPRVRVRTGRITTDWLPWIEARAGRMRTWSPPTIGEQVLLLCLGGDLRNGVILCGIPSDDFDTPSHSPDETVTQYPDGATVTYNHASGKLSVSGIKLLVIEAATSVLVRCPETTFDGDVIVKGLLSYQNGIAGQGGGNGNTISGDLTHQGGKLSSNGVVVHEHDHGNVRRGGERTSGPR